MRPVFIFFWLIAFSLAQPCQAQGVSGPFSNAKSIWETEPTEQQSDTGKANTGNLNANTLNAGKQQPSLQTPRPIAIPSHSAPRSIVPASLERQSPASLEKQALAPKTASTTTTASTISSKRTALPLRKPGETLTKQEKQETADRKRLGSTTQQLGTTTLVLGGIIVVILLASRLMKKHTRVGTMNLSSEVLEVLGRKMLDQKHAIHYVLCGNRILILGTSLEGIRTLAEITDPVEIDRIRGECKPISVESTIGHSFGFLLSRTERETEHVNLDKQHRRRQKKRSSLRKGSKRSSRDRNQPPAPDLADFGLNIDAMKEGRS